MDIRQLLEYTLTRKASDLHLIVSSPPLIRVNGIIYPVLGEQPLKKEDTERLIFALLNENQKEILLVNKELDFSFPYGDQARFRVNAYHQKGTLAAALRLIPFKIPTINELSLPKICYEFAKLRQGFILVTGPTGHGKSTTLAAIIDEINRNRPVHIVTIEDPVEYVFQNRKAIVSQREMRADTHSWEISLRSCLREDPDVVMIGEMRDYETISSALTIAETGHLVFATLHTNSAAQSIDRIVDVFPEEAKTQARMQFSNTLEAILSQRLIPSLDGKLLPAVEVLISTPAVRNSIRENKTHLIDNIIQTSVELGMKTLEMDLFDLVKAGKISLETAQAFSLRPGEIERLDKGHSEK